ncbi:hypothetical protein M407DRAFT_235068 [Tulasnella calospora MUT 4182]|uniref:Uncharacterized protein n=1 Tax=Tulasnella calospora MUT 4182 TaxID=1051891 RepID=A0A0C3KYH0_9AGAM|nr:hypothetical protein M407DRAFT_235068 [Tulasnella calospora MUT 4182]
MSSRKGQKSKPSKYHSHSPSPPQTAGSSESKRHTTTKSHSKATLGAKEVGSDAASDDGMEELNALESFKPKKTSQLFRSFAANTGIDTQTLKAAKAKAERQDALRGYHHKTSTAKKVQGATKESKQKVESKERSASPKGKAKMRGRAPANGVHIAGIVWMRKGPDAYRHPGVPIPDAGLVKKWAAEGFAVLFERGMVELSKGLDAEETYFFIKEHLPGPIGFQEQRHNPYICANFPVEGFSKQAGGGIG